MHRSFLPRLVTLGFITAATGGCGADEPILGFKGKDFAAPFFGHNFSFKNPKAQLLRFEVDDLTRIDQILSDHLLDAGMPLNGSLRLDRQSKPRNTTGDSWEASALRDYSIEIEGIKVCGAQVKALKMNNSYNTAALANLPNANATVAEHYWIEPSEAQKLTELAMMAEGFEFQSIELGSLEKCFLPSDDQLKPVWHIELLADNILFRAHVDNDNVYDLTQVSFHADAKARIYASNPNDGKLKWFTLKEMEDDGTLENTYFTVSTTGKKVKETSLTFDFDPVDDADEFDQLSLFVNANRQYDWFRELGHEWSGSSKLAIVAHAIVGGHSNNALYTPGTRNSPPRIQVGDGDGVRLQNLARDGDVVSHELGHHIVYDNLKEVKGESLVIHEALADFFTFARTNDGCLGESICPKGSDAQCEVDGQCLRSGDNDYVLGKNTKREAHFKSQFISGMLWELHEGKVPERKLEKIVMDGLSLLLESSGYHDLILSLLLADENLYEGKYCKKIYETAKVRGLGDYISEFGCDGNLPSLKALDNNGGTIAASKKSSGSSSDNPFCGTLAGASDSSANNVWIVIMLILPALLTLRSQRNKVSGMN